MSSVMHNDSVDKKIIDHCLRMIFDFRLRHYTARRLHSVLLDEGFETEGSDSGIHKWYKEVAEDYGIQEYFEGIRCFKTLWREGTTLYTEDTYISEEEFRDLVAPKIFSFSELDPSIAKELLDVADELAIDLSYYNKNSLSHDDYCSILLKEVSGIIGFDRFEKDFLCQRLTELDVDLIKSRT